MREDDLLDPNNEYGVTKSAATLYCSYFGKKEQLPVYTFRLFAVYGYLEDATRLIPSIMTSYAQSKSPSLSRPTSVRDFIFIEDVVQYYLHVDSIQGDFG
jgi:nucleoside-diphosphate-sugar epimerase